MSKLLDLCRNTGGNVAMTFALAIVPVLLGAGAAMDMVRANSARSSLQAAADAAALAGGSSKLGSEAEIIELASRYLEANGVGSTVKKLKVADLSNDASTGTFKVKLKGSVKTSFLAVAGISSFDIDVESEVMRGSSGPLEMVLALDTTYSMTANGKIGTLKTAAANLVNSVMATSNVKVGVVPFSDYFKIGMAYKNEPWLNIPDDKDESYESCDYSYTGKTGCSVQTTCYADGLPYSCSYETCSSWGDPVKSNCSTTTYHYTWQGCIAARPAAYHDKISNPEVPYPGVLWDCGAAMLDMTSSKPAVLSSIDGLWPSGNTNIPSGLIWAWNMLTPREPLIASAPMSMINDMGGKKVLVLMTDGANSSSPYADGNYGAHAGTALGDGTYTDNLTATLCQKIKDEGIAVYTIQFDVTDVKIEKLLRDCASDPANSFVANDAGELLSAFNDIGVSLTKLRLVK